MSNNLSRVEQRIISFDFGSVKSSISYARLAGGFTELPSEVHTLLFEGNCPEIASQIAYDHSKQDWILGDELENSIWNVNNPDGTIPEESIITMPKLCLDKSTHEHVRKRVKKQLNRLGPLMDAKTGTIRVFTYKDVCIEFLKRLYQYAVKQIPAYLPGKFRQEDYICVLSFPAVWGLPPCTRLGDIASHAGLTNVDPISEPEAAAAYVIRKQLQEKTKFDGNSTWSPAKKFLVINAGEGTVVRVYEHSADKSTPLTVVFKRISSHLK